MSNELDQLSEHDAREDHQMNACQRLRQAFIVAGKSPEPTCPGEIPFHDPAFWQQHEPALGRLQLDHLQSDAVGLGFSGWLLSPE